MRYFTPQNTTIGSHIEPADLSIMNRAAQNLVRDGMSPTARWLGAIRAAYKRGMSAREVIEAVNAERESARSGRNLGP